MRRTRDAIGRVGAGDSVRPVERALALFCALACAAATPPRAAPSSPEETSHTIVMHVGVPGVAYIGQPLKELLAKFPHAKQTPFAKQEDVVIVSIPDQGLSCYAVGPAPDSLTLASVGFNFDETYEGVQAGDYRTREGIGRGSTVNDLLGTYGPPETVAGERSPSSALRRSSPPGDRDGPKKYTYASPDGKVKTYIVVEGYRVMRLVVNDLAPLKQYLLKTPPEKN